MKEFFLAIVISGIGIVLNGNAYAVDTDKAKSSPTGREQTQDTKEKNGVPDETQKQYLTRLKRINKDLRNKHSAFAKNYLLTKGNPAKSCSSVPTRSAMAQQAARSG